MRRRLLLIFVALSIGAVLLVATLPLWLGPAVRWAGASRGLTFARYERLGYSRFALHDVEYHRANVRVTVTRAEADTPVLWGWRHWQSGDHVITASDWRVEVEPSKAPPADPDAARGWMPLRGQLQRIATALGRWLPKATAGAGVVRFPGGEIAVDSARWASRELIADGVAYRALKVDASVAFGRDDTLRVAAHTPPAAANSLAAKLESAGDRVTGEFRVFEQPASFAAKFAPRGWLPAEAALKAQDWVVPADKLRLGAAYTKLGGSAEINWRAGSFAANVSAKGEPVPGKSAPPLEITARGTGDLVAFTVEAFQALLPGITANLTAPVTIERSGKIRESAARFVLAADLAKQPWFAAKGNVQGEAKLVSGFAPAPVVEFTLEAHGLAARDVNLRSVSARGRLNWPRIEVSDATIVGGAGEQLTARGGYDIREKQVLDSAVVGEVRRQSIARWLPAQPGFETVKISAQASGALTELKHAGHAAVNGVKAPDFNPFALTADWRGTAVTIDDFKVEAVANASKITAVGRADRESLRLTAFTLAQGDTERLHLAEPAVIRWKPQLQLESLRLIGDRASISASATVGETGRIELSAREISSRWLTDFVPTPGPAWQLTLLALQGAWDRGPMNFTLSAGAALEIAEGRTAAVTVSARGEKDGLHIDALRATESEANVVNAVGRLPIRISPVTKPLLQIDQNGALQLEATVEPNSAFWQKLAAASGIDLKDPQASAQLKGTWQRPQGYARLKAARIAVDPKRVQRALPAVDDLDVEITGDRDGVTLTKFSLSVEGQAVRAQGRLPVTDGKWDQLLKAPLATARNGADLRLEIPDADVAVFARFLPAMLAPKGRLQADLHYKSGGLEGFLKLRDAASRPLGPLGVLQEINADIALAGRKLALRGVTARSGGQPITLTGTIELPENSGPRFDLALRGENLPFVRQTGLLLRGDLDLKLQTPAGGVPRLSGNVKLRDSLFLSDVRAFLPKGGGTSPTRRPPYFAIEMPPVNAWALAIGVSGDQFMRLRTPVFVGVASAHFRLSGTLGEPRAIGEVAIDDGRVRMPFASFAVTQGSVRLTEADPYQPAIYLRATGRRYGYDLTMEIDGDAAQPNVTFTSSPALDSEQVLLMVMTGAAPSNEINGSATQRMANIGYFLGSSLLGSLGADAADADRLSIASGEKVSRQGRETYDIEYKLSDRWSLTGEYNEFDEYNAGVKWRIFRDKRNTEPKTEHAKK